MKCQMIFQLSIAGSAFIHEKFIINSSYPGALKSYKFAWNINIFNPPGLYSLQRVSCFILEV